MIGYIYKYENIINHKVYIGQTTDIINRKSSHRYKAQFVKSKFYNAVRKYGWDSFKFDIIAQVEADTKQEVAELLDPLEIRYIQQYDSFSNGYNSTAGGHCYRGKTVTEEFREYCRNRTYSEETRKKMSIAASNRVVSDETREKLRQRAMERNFSQYRITNADKRLAALRKAKCNPVDQIDKNGIIVNTFPSVQDAVHYIMKYLAKNKTYAGIENGVLRHCRGEIKKKFYYGYAWEYAPKV